MKRAAILATLVAAAASSARADDACTDALDEPAAVPWRDAGWDAGRGFEFTIKAQNYLDARWSIEALTAGP